MKKTNLFCVLFSALLFTIFLFLVPAVNAANTNFTVYCSSSLGAISPYVYGHNTSGIYYSTPMYNASVRNLLRDSGITMLRFPPGTKGNQYDFKYNNYKGRYSDTGTPWRTDCTSIEDELRFCNDLGMKALVEVNTAFQGPNGNGWGESTSTNYHADDFNSYTGCETSTDTPQSRAQYAADMVTHVQQLCNTYNWEYPRYYEVGNEWRWNGLHRSSYVAYYEAYSTAMKAVNPGIKLLLGSDNGPPIIPTLGAMQVVPDIHNYHFYAGYKMVIPGLAYSPGVQDGTFTTQAAQTVSYFSTSNMLQDMLNGYNTYLPGHGEVVFANSEWGDDSDAGSSKFNTYTGAMFSAHMIFSSINNKLIISCPWSMWSVTGSTYALIGPPPDYKPRPRFYVYKMYKNFGDTLIKCEDTNPGGDLIMQASIKGSTITAIMAINLSSTTGYNAQINISGFDMSGTVDVYSMNEANCYEGGPGPANSTLTGQTSTINYTFPPFTVTCLVVRGKTADQPPVTEPPGQITDTITAYPNPFNLAAGKPLKFRIDGAKGGEVNIYTTSGRLVKKITTGTGAAEINWDCLNESGEKIKVGIYVFSITSNSGAKKTGKIIVTK